MPDKKISVLIVDDSAFMRKAIQRMLTSDPAIAVVGQAEDGPAAIEAFRQLAPDVVTLDVTMPGMNGLDVLRRIMTEKPTPVLMVSTSTSDGGETTLKALELGAVDFIDKTSCHTAMDILHITDTLVQKVKVIAGVDITKTGSAPDFELPPLPRISQPLTNRLLVPSHLVVIGTSTGGPMALETVLSSLPESYPGAILVVQHMPVGFTASLAERMNRLCHMDVAEAAHGEPILSGKVYIAPGGQHLEIRHSKDQYLIDLSKDAKDAQHCPSVNVMMKSVARNWPGRILAIIMTGMGGDGAEGIEAVKQKGGTVLAQDEATCIVFGMPRAASLTGFVDRMVPLDKIPFEICKFK